MNTNIDAYEEKVAALNAQYPALKAHVKRTDNNLFIEVATVDKAKACNEMFNGFRFSSGWYY